MPPVKVFQDVALSAHDILGKGLVPEADYKGVSYAPFLGRAFYDRYLGGNERKEIVETRQFNMSVPKDQRKEYSDSAKAYLEMKREAARALKEARDGQ